MTIIADFRKNGKLNQVYVNGWVVTIMIGLANLPGKISSKFHHFSK